jgi:hypothetical protein
VNKLDRSIEDLRYDRGMPVLMRRVGQESVRSRSTLAIIERLTEYDLAVRESGLSTEPFSLDRRSTVTGSIS